MKIPNDMAVKAKARNRLKDQISAELDEHQAEFVLTCVESLDYGPSILAYARMLHEVQYPPEFTATERTIWSAIISSSDFVSYEKITQARYPEAWCQIEMDDSQLYQEMVVIRAHIKNMRKKLKNYHHPYQIDNRPGYGYKLVKK